MLFRCCRLLKGSREGIETAYLIFLGYPMHRGQLDCIPVRGLLGASLHGGRLGRKPSWLQTAGITYLKVQDYSIRFNAVAWITPYIIYKKNVELL